jgi:hypothetical protein
VVSPTPATIQRIDDAEHIATAVPMTEIGHSVDASADDLARPGAGSTDPKPRGRVEPTAMPGRGAARPGVVLLRCVGACRDHTTPTP